MIISRGDIELLEALPDGSIVRIPGHDEVLTMNRADMADAFFDCSDGGWLRCNNVFAFYEVGYVVVDDITSNPYRE